MKEQGFAPMPPVPVPVGTPPERREGGDSSGGSISGEPRDRDAMDQEKRLRREIANSNERRRMQSINAGFQSLRNLLPHHEGEKLSKAAILQQTAEYIHQLEQDKSRLMAQNSQLMKRFNSSSSSSSTTNAAGATAAATTNAATSGTSSGEGSSTSANTFSSPHSPAGENPPAIIKRRKTLDGSVESADEGIGSMSPDHNGEEYRNEVTELRRETMGLRIQLDRERRHRLSLEDTLSTMRNQPHHEAQQQHQEQPQQQQIIEQQIVYVHQQPATVQIKMEPEMMQTTEETEVYHRVPAPPRNSHDDYRVRHNLNSIVEAIRQLEGDHLFADDRSPPRNTVSPPSSSPRAMEVCNSTPEYILPSPTNLPPPPPVSSVRQPWSGSCQPPSYKPVSASSEKPLALTTFSVAPSEHHVTSYHQTSATVVPVSTTVTSLKHHVLNRLARSNELDEQPINLEYRPAASRSPSPPPTQHHHHMHIQHLPQVAHQQPPQQSISQFHLQQQQQLRPGVIVVKHS